MTTGTKDFNNFTVIDDTWPGNGTSWIGVKGSKVWSGGDDPLKHRAINAYTMTLIRDASQTLRWKFSNNNPPGEWSTGTAGFLGIARKQDSWTSNDQLTLINRLGDNVRKHDFNAAQSIGAEGKDALRQIANTAMGVARGLRDLKRGDFAGVKRNFGISYSEAKRAGLHKDLSNRVLATQLGWLPLMSDCKSAADAFYALSAKNTSKTYQSSVTLKGYAYDVWQQGVKVGQSYIRKRLHWTLSEDLTWNESLGLSNPWDFVGSVYAATPLSFIADWFLPIGKYLNARSNASVLKGKGYISTTDYLHGVTSLLPLGYVNLNGARYSQTVISVKREVLSALAVPLPTFVDLKKIPSWKRALTATALAAQKLT